MDTFVFKKDHLQLHDLERPAFYLEVLTIRKLAFKAPHCKHNIIFNCRGCPAFCSEVMPIKRLTFKASHSQWTHYIISNARNLEGLRFEYCWCIRLLIRKLPHHLWCFISFSPFFIVCFPFPHFCTGNPGQMNRKVTEKPSSQVKLFSSLINFYCYF